MGALLSLVTVLRRRTPLLIERSRASLSTGAAAGVMFTLIGLEFDLIVPFSIGGGGGGGICDVKLGEWDLYLVAFKCGRELSAVS